MTIKFYNSLTNQKEDFVPIREGEVGMYVCGMTVYDNCHLGHARAMMAFDILARYLRYQGYKVNFIRNITDIDDNPLGIGQGKQGMFSRTTEIKYQTRIIRRAPEANALDIGSLHKA